MLSIFSSTPHPACPTPFNLAAHVLAGGVLHGEATALQVLRSDGAERWTYHRLIAAVRGFGTGLLKFGLGPGDRIILLLGNDAAFPIAFLGAISVGIIPVPLSTQLTPPEIDKVLAAVTPALILTCDGVALPTAATCPVLPASATFEISSLGPSPWAMGDPDRLAWMSFTSGTTGSARAVMHAHRSIWARQMARAGWTGLRQQDRLLHAGAFNWTYTLGVGLLDPWSLGAMSLIPAAAVKPADLPGLLARTEATVFAATPAVYRQMLRHPMPDLPHMRHALSAGEKLSDDVASLWRTATGTPIFEAYGMTECSIFISGSAARPAPPGTIGYAQGGRRIAILGPDHAPVPRGTPGMLAIDRTDPGVFLGYYGRSGETTDSFSGEWFLTGDTASMAEDGAIVYLGRSDDMMNAGGTRVSPLEVEAVMADVADLTDVGVTEVTVRPGVSVVACFYVAASPIAEDVLTAHAATRLARYKQPRIYVRVPALPRNANQKLLRRELRRIWESENGQA
jgi:acyl-coenzyme A synthetase/AMP-(fatty) acid ligase